MWLWYQIVYQFCQKKKNEPWEENKTDGVDKV